MNTPTATETTYRCIAQSRTTGKTFSLGEITIQKTNGGKAIPMPYLQPDETLEFLGIDAGFPPLIVQTTGREIIRLFQDLKKMKRIQLFQLIKRVEQSLNEAKQKDFNKMADEAGDDWGNLMDDVMIYYCARYRLFKTPLPVPG